METNKEKLKPKILTRQTDPNSATETKSPIKGTHIKKRDKQNKLVPQEKIEKSSRVLNGIKNTILRERKL